MKMLVMGDTEPFVHNLIRSLASMRVECHVFDRGRMWSVFLSKHCRGYVNTAVFSDEALLDRINEYCAKNAITIIIPGDYRASQFLLKARASLAQGVSLFPSSDLATLEILNNKDSFVRLLQQEGLPHPRTIIVENFAQMEALDIGYPCVVKPARCEGGAFEKYLKNDRDSFLDSARSGAEFPLLVQEIIPGSDVGLNILAHKGRIIAWTMQEYLEPFKIRFFSSDELLGLGHKIVAAVGYEGIANFDLKRDSRDGSFKFIECNPRWWNSMYGSTCKGVNFAAIGLGLREARASFQNGPEGLEYLFPFYAVRKLLKGQLAWRDVPLLTRQDLRSQLADPLSLLWLVFFRQRRALLGGQK